MAAALLYKLNLKRVRVARQINFRGRAKKVAAINIWSRSQLLHGAGGKKVAVNFVVLMLVMEFGESFRGVLIESCWRFNYLQARAINKECKWL